MTSSKFIWHDQSYKICISMLLKVKVMDFQACILALHVSWFWLCDSLHVLFILGHILLVGLGYWHALQRVWWSLNATLFVNTNTLIHLLPWYNLKITCYLSGKNQGARRRLHVSKERFFACWSKHFTILSLERLWLLPSKI